MIVKSIQFEINVKNPLENIKKGLSLLSKSSNKDADLIVMPEMWSVGLYPELKESKFLNETEKILDEVLKISKKFDTIIIPGSLPLLKNGDIYNTSFFVTPHGISVNSYKKNHLFKVGGEDKYTKAGDKLAVFDTKFGKISPLICYDLRFAEMFRTLAMRDVSIFIISAQWPMSRKDHWSSLLKARAIENQAFVIATNLCGHDGRLEFAADSVIIDPWGNILELAENKETILSCKIDYNQPMELREKFPFLHDAIWRKELIDLWED
jgi:predicted amidohydrolase